MIRGRKPEVLYLIRSYFMALAGVRWSFVVAAMQRNFQMSQLHGIFSAMHKHPAYDSLPGDSNAKLKYLWVLRCEQQDCACLYNSCAPQVRLSCAEAAGSCRNGFDAFSML